MSSESKKGREGAHKDVPGSGTPDPDESRISREGLRALPDEDLARLISDLERRRIADDSPGSSGELTVTPHSTLTWHPPGEEVSDWTVNERAKPSPDLIEEDIEPGMVLLDKYQVLRKLGEGGLANLWLVQHLAIGEARVLKVIRSLFARQPTNCERFNREARILAKLKHPNSAIVHDAGIVGGLRYIEMEYLAGKSLREMLDQGQPRPLSWVDWVLREVCDVLARAHDLGIVHLDLKPSNIIITPDPDKGLERLKVFDFGIAMILGGELADADSWSHPPGAMIGTPGYASPEQFNLLREKERPVPIDQRSDIYSLGVILYEMLTGRRPFEGELREIITQLAHQKPPRFAEVAPENALPTAIEDLVLQCLEKDPNDRPESASELAHRFNLLVKGKRPYSRLLDLINGFVSWLGRVLRKLVPGWSVPTRHGPVMKLGEEAEPSELQKLPGLIQTRTDVEFPARVVVGDPYYLDIHLVSVGGDAPAEDRLPPQLPAADGMINFFVSFMTSAPGRGLPPAKVKVSISVAAENFEIVGNGRAEVDVSQAHDSPVVQFVLRGVRVGRGRVMIDFAQGGVPAGSMDLEPEVVASIEAPDPLILCAPVSEGLILNLVAGPPAASPDLAIKVLEHRYAGQGSRLQFIVSSPLCELSDLRLFEGDFGVVDLKTDVAEWVEARLSAIAALAHEDDATPDRVSRTLAGVGYSLFDQVLPKDLQDLYWTIRGRNVRTILVLSDEPHIPWELIKPFRENPTTGAFEEGEFWGQSYALTRWLRGRPPAQKFSSQRIYAVAPRAEAAPGSAAMPPRDMVPLSAPIASESSPPGGSFPGYPLSPEEELEVLRSLEAAGSLFKLLPARCYDILKAFEQGEFDLFHVAAHGQFAGSSNADASAVLMEDGAFRAADLSPVMAMALRRSTPLIFFNSCHSGRLGFSLTRLGSWGAQFVHLGCGGFVGTLWPVTDRAASVFAQAFYRSMFEGQPIGEAMLQARRRVHVRYPDDPTWLAYCCFANPQARIDRLNTSRAETHAETPAVGRGRGPSLPSESGSPWQMNAPQ
jgi:serine/threonine protein kinase